MPYAWISWLTVPTVGLTPTAFISAGTSIALPRALSPPLMGDLTLMAPKVAVLPLPLPLQAGLSQGKLPGPGKGPGTQCLAGRQTASCLARRHHFTSAE